MYRARHKIRFVCRVHTGGIWNIRRLLYFLLLFGDIWSVGSVWEAKGDSDYFAGETGRFSGWYRCKFAWSYPRASKVRPQDDHDSSSVSSFCVWAFRHAMIEYGAITDGCDGVVKLSCFLEAISMDFMVYHSFNDFF